MEMERVTEFPLGPVDLRPRKRQRLGWDVGPQVTKAQLGLFCGQDVGNVASFAPAWAPSDSISSTLVKHGGRNGSPPWRKDDKDGHYVFAVGDNLTSRCNYLLHHQIVFILLIVDKIHGKMGEGTFGQVLECWDKEREEMVAVKIVRGIKKYREAAMIEIDVLQQLGKHDKGGNRCVQIRNWFDYRNHICIVSINMIYLGDLFPQFDKCFGVFEKLGPSLYDFLRKNNYRSFPIDLVREIGRQLLECIAFMHDLRLIHTDLKPENILLVSPEYVKVLDYKGSSRSPKDSSYSKRVPKSSAIKVIDFGSTTYDRHGQSYVVSTRHYRAPEVASWLSFARRHADKYIRKGRLDWPEGATSRGSVEANLIMQHVDHSAGDLIHLLQGLLRYDPLDRLTARESLRHPFFTRDNLRRY
ncbi:Protein kinase, catalytic domain-containing protein [Cynara cardunculus var. scolymus]|uniref:Protein kinase, catalytic domain-containing protein n=1 Tax=Cynara cardunculus var. scolymus TaxID=59895 RepID=A0A103XXZ3_CYNCS|nr:Protein kinase, catalytic domain-containing protein [Cynara cardunculus var. scolymus]